MEQPHAHDPMREDPVRDAPLHDGPARDSRTIRKATPHHPMRPFIVGVGVVAVLGGVIVAASRYEGGTGDPAALVSPGAMHVEDTEVLPPGLSGLPKADAGARGSGPVPVKFYEALEKGEQAGLGGGEIAVRSMPMPPPAGAEGSSKPLAQATAPAPEKKPAPAPHMMAPEPEPKAAAAPSEKAPAPKPAAPQMEKPVAPATASVTPEPAGPPMKRPYTLQVGSFSRKNGAEELMGRLKDKGQEAYLTEVDLGSKGVWYRVRVGRYPTEHAAKWARLDLVREGLSPIVVHDPKGP